MANIVLISCVSKKLDYPSKAKDLYISPLFRLNLEYSKKLTPDQVFILSAKYGLIELDEVISPYDLTLNNMSVKDRKAWSSKVLSQLRIQTDLDRDKFIFLAGQKYRQYIIPYLKSYEIPLEGLTIGKQLQFLKSQVDNG